MPEETVDLTLFLLRPEKVGAFEAAFPPTASGLPLAPPLSGRFIQLPAEERPPSWQAAVQSMVESPGDLNLSTKAPAGLLVLNRGDRTFVATFGQAWRKLDPDWLEPLYGRRVALNAIATNALLEVRTEQVFAKWHLASDRAPRAASLDEFSVEFDRDLVARVAGLSTDPLLGRVVAGGTNLRLRIEVASLGSVLDRSAELFASDAYSKRWPDIDNVQPVGDSGQISALTFALDKVLATKKADGTVVMATPTQRQGDDVVAEAYVLGRLHKNAPKRPYLQYSMWVSDLIASKRAPSVEAAKYDKVHCLDADGGETLTCSVYACLGCELTLDGKQYVLSSGNWYEVTPSFLKRINATVGKIPSPPLKLPTWQATESEADYNARCGALPGVLHMDRKTVWFGGKHSQFEFCDFLQFDEHALYFAKIPTKSSGMSHLLEQVRRTVELFFGLEPAYRVALKKVFTQKCNAVDVSWLDSRPRTGDWKLCLVSLGRSAAQLPLFARCGLYRLAKELRERGHDIYFAGV